MLRKNSNNSEVLKTILYSDIFNYPLTKEEINKYLIITDSEDKNTVDIQIKSLLKKDYLSLREGFYCLKGKEGIIKERLKKEKISEQKIKYAEKIVNMLKYVPTIQLIGLSGSVAVKNANTEDDIDLFIISRGGTIWLTRLVILFFLQFLGVRRKKEDKYVKNKLCVNMLISESNLKIPKESQNIYSAHEVCQMRPMFDRENFYSRFLYSNKWVIKFLPNAMRLKDENFKTQAAFNIMAIMFLPELLAKLLQIWYMRKEKTTEIISDKLLAFHTIDRERQILNLFKKKTYEYAL